jgi:hypothetical protein
MICPKCEREFASLGGHVKKCKCLTDVDEIRKMWRVTANIIALGEPSNPDTMCGIQLVGLRKLEKEHTFTVSFGVTSIRDASNHSANSNIKFSALRLEHINGIDYTCRNNKATEDYQGEINKIIANWESFATAKIPDSCAYGSEAFTHVLCDDCGARHVPGITSAAITTGGFHLCIGCMLVHISWIIQQKYKVIK